MDARTDRFLRPAPLPSRTAPPFLPGPRPLPSRTAPASFPYRARFLPGPHPLLFLRARS